MADEIIETPTDEQWAQLAREQAGQPGVEPTQEQLMRLFVANPHLFAQTLQQMGVQVAAPQPAQPPVQKTQYEIELEQLQAQRAQMEQQFAQPGYQLTQEEYAKYQAAMARINALEVNIPLHKQALAREEQMAQQQNQIMLSQVPALVEAAVARLKQYASHLFMPDQANRLPPINEAQVRQSAHEQIVALINAGRGQELLDNRLQPIFHSWAGQLQDMRWEMARRLAAPPSAGAGHPPGGVPPVAPSQQANDYSNPLGTRDLDI